MKILVTGATGKVGRAFIEHFCAHPPRTDAVIRAFCHRRAFPEIPSQIGIESIQGSMANREDVRRALDGVTHVLHLATCKETPEAVMDVTVKGLFWLLEECRLRPGFEQFILIGGDAGMGHFFYPHPLPVTETQGHSAYPGCYALSKVLEEVMLEQYRIQYQLPGCCLRAPWIMEKDDFRHTLSFGDDVFGGPRWIDLVGTEKAAAFAAAGTVPVLCDSEGRPVKRNFVHVDDLVAAIMAALANPAAAIGETFNIGMDEPVDYRAVADHLAATRGLPSVDIPSPYHSTWLDNAKAKFLLGWRPQIDLPALIERSWNYVRGEDDPRKIWYPG
jgi:UDP-glucose 4-epimerase